TASGGAAHALMAPRGASSARGAAEGPRARVLARVGHQGPDRRATPGVTRVAPVGGSRRCAVTVVVAGASPVHTLVSKHCADGHAEVEVRAGRPWAGPGRPSGGTEQ